MAAPQTGMTKSNTNMKRKNELGKYEANVLENIGRDGEMYSLNDLWVIAGSPETKRPNDWQNTQQGADFIYSACKILNATKNGIIKSKRGKGGGTYGIRQVALEYAQYLDADLAVLVNEVFFQRLEEEKNPDLIGKRYIEAYKRRGKSDEWITARLKGIQTRNLFTDTLKSHQVIGLGYRNCTNAIYRPLFGGNASVIRAKKNITSATTSTRDCMNRTELIAVELAESLATDHIEENNVLGNRKCEIVSENASRCVAGAISRFKRM